LNNFLSQEEIDALLKQQSSPSEINDTKQAAVQEDLDKNEKDALGEIGNISMGTAATALSELLNQKVSITTPRVEITTQQELFGRFGLPYAVVEVKYVDGLVGSNLFIMKVIDVAVIADLMMGGDGRHPVTDLSELHLSAVAEAMNQMIGSSATSMSTIFHKRIEISPPKIQMVDFQEDSYESPLGEQLVVIIAFRMVVGDLVDSKIMLIMSLGVAKTQVQLLFNSDLMSDSSTELTEKEMGTENQVTLSDMNAVGSVPGGNNENNEITIPTNVNPPVNTPPKAAKDVKPRNIDLIMDIPLQVTVVLGRTKKEIKDVLNFIPGTIIELEKLAEEPVEILINGMLVAQGEVVVINESFGVRISNIISPADRMHYFKQ
jgi:flagellar motor switch protein FliN/FliY